MAVSLREIPEITGAEIDDLELAFRVEDRDLAMAVDDVGPLRGIVPVHFAGAARVHEEMCAGDAGGEWQSARRYFAGPAAGRRLDGTLVEGRLENDAVAGLSWNRLQIFGGGRNVI